MPLSAETLQPLTSSTVEFDYCHDRPLRSLASRFVLRDQPADDVPGRTTCSLLMCAGISLQKETWVPVIKRLYHLTSQPQSKVTIHSVWVVERPNHGDAGVMNEAMLKEHYNVIFPSLQYAAAIRAFLAADFISARERANLVAVGHSGAGGSILQAMEPATSNLPISRFMLVEAPHIGHEAWEPMKFLYKMVKASNSRRKTSWESVDEGMAYFKKRPPCKTYHPEVWQIMSETYFRKDANNPERITTKTTVEQETACFLDDGTHLGALDYLRSILHVLPSHLILGTEEDIWPPEIYQQQRENVEQTRAALASVSYIEGAGHYLPVQMPDELATEMARLLNEHVGGAKFAKL
ncbi:Alpha/beta hydrolase fold-1 [Daedaleopsis nitida]|nr:Alpha/beta hydrolase fold-1 [Daedaleopsis nitida]